MDRNTPIQHIMTRDLITLHPGDNLHDVKSIFDHNPIRHILIVDDQNKYLGILSKEDFLRAAYNLSIQTSGKTYSMKSYLGQKVKDIMTISTVYLNVKDTIGIAADILMSNNFHALPIVEDSKAIGIVTTYDLLRHAFEKMEDTYPANQVDVQI